MIHRGPGRGGNRTARGVRGGNRSARGGEKKVIVKLALILYANRVFLKKY